MSPEGLSKTEGKHDYARRTPTNSVEKGTRPAKKLKPLLSEDGIHDGEIRLIDGKRYRYCRCSERPRLHGVWVSEDVAKDLTEAKKIQQHVGDRASPDANNSGISLDSFRGGLSIYVRSSENHLCALLDAVPEHPAK